MGGRIHVEADNNLDLGDESGIARTFERVQPMRLEPVSDPDLLHGPQRSLNSTGYGTTTSVGNLDRRLRAGQRQRLGHGRMGRRAGQTRLV